MIPSTFFDEFSHTIQLYKHYEERGTTALFEEIRDYSQRFSSEERRMIETSFTLAQEAHKGTLRWTGAPYITHPLVIACMMLPYMPDAYLISATLLHDTIEDTDVTFEEIEKIHPVIAQIVEGATKIRALSRTKNKNIAQENVKFETIRKILTASEDDLRILFLKIFDRLHNMITLDGKNEESKKRIATETIEIYSPLAKRVGLRKVYHLLKGLSFRILNPERWSTWVTFSEKTAPALCERSQSIQDFFWENWHDLIVAMDAKFLSPFSSDISDYYQEDEWISTRIVVPDVGSCYTLLHELTKKQFPHMMLCGAVNDMIIHPRLSGYAGIHAYMIFEWIHKVKIRIIPGNVYNSTSVNHFDAISKIYSPVLFRDFDLINEATLSNSEAFIQSVREHILSRKIRLHSAKKSLFYLPIWLSLLDALIYLEPLHFPYADHICLNHDRVPLNTPLQMDDIITYQIGDHINPHTMDGQNVVSGISRWRIEHVIDRE